MSGHSGNLTTKQQAALAEFQENIRDVQPEHDEEDCLRWLRARCFDVKKAEQMFRASLQWRKTFGADQLLETYTAPEVLKKYWPGGMHGFDKRGCPIWIDTPGYTDVKGLMYSCKKQELLKYKVSHCEEIQKTFREQRLKLGHRVDGLIIIFDLDKYGMKHLWKPVIDIYMSILSIFESNYPETLYRCYVINAPRIFPVAYNIIKPVLSEDTKNKVHVLGSHWKERILQDIDADQLPPHWGGTCNLHGNDPYCQPIVNIGGTVPPEYLALKKEFSTSDFNRIQISRGSSQQIEALVSIPGSIIRWQFLSDGADIGFGVFRRTLDSKQKANEMECCVPSDRVNSHMVPEDGSFTAEVPGTYVLRFDNTYSWVTSKSVKYEVEVLPPGDISILHTSPSFAVKSE
ncbi:hypothetical protein CAPTEDRAFT_194024 [Capitella teleta]|uniref:CRAL-TRIO domain-containing protein n=1 Tax=Capitella teleta TaxID=283909 RepID=R7V421_CAPTE|nr:hypothetical protein CAPTEDRAFT_194024 [Capitella teleta]|eukprot:ELU10555.1 hypothetical protein CAPTEDRAFT_194024 [Capitella teleta]